MAKGLWANSMTMREPQGISVSSLIKILCDDGLNLSIGSLNCPADLSLVKMYNILDEMIFCFVVNSNNINLLLIFTSVLEYSAVILGTCVQ